MAEEAMAEEATAEEAMVEEAKVNDFNSFVNYPKMLILLENFGLTTALCTVETPSI